MVIFDTFIVYINAMKGNNKIRKCLRKRKLVMRKVNFYDTIVKTRLYRREDNHVENKL